MRLFSEIVPPTENAMGDLTTSQVICAQLRHLLTFGDAYQAVIEANTSEREHRDVAATCAEVDSVYTEEITELDELITSSRANINDLLADADGVTTKRILAIKQLDIHCVAYLLATLTKVRLCERVGDEAKEYQLEVDKQKAIMVEEEREAAEAAAVLAAIVEKVSGYPVDEEGLIGKLTEQMNSDSVADFPQQINCLLESKLHQTCLTSLFGAERTSESVVDVLKQCYKCATKPRQLD